MKKVVEVRKLINLEHLNKRIKCFNYGIIEAANKPCPIVLTKQGNLIGQRAAQTCCLLMYLPLIIGDVLKNAQGKSDLIYEKWTVIML